MDRSPLTDGDIINRANVIHENVLKSIFYLFEARICVIDLLLILPLELLYNYIMPSTINENAKSIKMTLLNVRNIEHNTRVI